MPGHLNMFAIISVSRLTPQMPRLRKNRVRSLNDCLLKQERIKGQAIALSLAFFCVNERNDSINNVGSRQPSRLWKRKPPKGSGGKKPNMLNISRDSDSRCRVALSANSVGHNSVVRSRQSPCSAIRALPRDDSPLVPP